MSHIVTIQTEVRDPTAIAAACGRLRLPAPIYGEAKLYAATATGWQVRLPEWRYAVVCQTDVGKVLFDNFEGNWGPQSRLDAFMQAYAVEKTFLEARRQGFHVTEQPIADGSIKVLIQVGGGA